MDTKILALAALSLLLSHNALAGLINLPLVNLKLPMVPQQRF